MRSRFAASTAMVAGDDSIDWRKLREFQDVELTQSYVLSWSVKGDSLLVDIDLLLKPDHPFFEKPRPAEKRCIRPAIIEFPFCESIRSDGIDAEESLSATVAMLGVGSITGLKRYNDGPFEISGEFGAVRIDAERPILRLRAP